MTYLRVSTVVSQNFGSSEEREDAMSAVEPILLAHKYVTVQWKTQNFDSRNIILAMEPTRDHI